MAAASTSPAASPTTTAACVVRGRPGRRHDTGMRLAERRA